jgi:hypothetical protein
MSLLNRPHPNTCGFACDACEPESQVRKLDLAPGQLSLVDAMSLGERLPPFKPRVPGLRSPYPKCPCGRGIYDSGIPGARSRFAGQNR